MYCLPYFTAGVGGHAVELVVKSLVYKLMHGLAENVALPDFLGIFLKLLEKIVYKLLGLLFAADYRSYLGLGFYLHHVDRGRACA